MAIVTRYFSTAAAGAGDGTTWADRAALFSAGNWSTVITGFNFSGSDSLECRIGPGTYTNGQNFTSALFSNPPTSANQLFMVACDSSGNQWSPPDPNWKSCQPVWDTTDQPILSMSSTSVTIGCTHTNWRGVRFLHSSRNGGVVTACNSIRWFTVENSTSNTASTCIDSSTVFRAANGVLTMSGTSYNNAAQQLSSSHNLRLVGNLSATSGSRNGLRLASNVEYYHSSLTICDHVGYGISQESTGTSAQLILTDSSVINCQSNGINLNSGRTASPSYILACLIVNCGGWGVNNAGSGEVMISDTRLRDNSSGNITGVGNYPSSGNGIYTTDTDDTEFVDYTGKDFSIANTAATYGMGFGPGDGPAASGGGGSALHLGALGQTGIGAF